MAKKTTKTAEEQAALEDFTWDDTGDDGTGDFFGVAGTAVEEEKLEPITTPTTEEEEEEEERITPPSDETETEEEEEEIIFDEFENDAEEQEEEEEQEEANEYKALALKLIKEGVLTETEFSEDEEFTGEKFIELQDKEIESRVDEAFEGFFSELDKDAAAFLKFKKEGGDTQEFFKVYKDSGKAPVGDLEDESYQEQVSRYYYANVENDDAEDIESKIEWLKDSGKLEKFARKFDTKIKDSEEKAKEDLQRQAKEASKEAAKSRERFVNSVQEALQVVEKVDNFIFTAESKKSLLPFITKQTVKVGKNRYITPMQSKLQTALKDPEKMLVLAQLLENDFDVSPIVAKDATTKAKKLKNDIQRNKASKLKSTGKTGKKRSLADIDF